MLRSFIRPILFSLAPTTREICNPCRRPFTRCRPRRFRKSGWYSRRERPQPHQSQVPARIEAFESSGEEDSAAMSYRGRCRGHEPEHQRPRPRHRREDQGAFGAVIGGLRELVVGAQPDIQRDDSGHGYDSALVAPFGNSVAYRPGANPGACGVPRGAVAVQAVSSEPVSTKLPVMPCRLNRSMQHTR